jgi:hypothetical protein
MGGDSGNQYANDSISAENEFKVVFATRQIKTKSVSPESSRQFHLSLVE